MIRSIRVYFPVASMLLFFLSGTQAQEQGSFTPARFGTGERSLVANLHWPILDYDNDLRVMVFCSFLVDLGGNVPASGCIANEKMHRKFAQNTRKALAHAVLKPATVNSKPVSVLLFARVLFVCNNSKCEAFAIPNLGYHYKEYGLNYYAPQQIQHGFWVYEKLHAKSPVNGTVLQGVEHYFTTVVNSDGTHNGLKPYPEPGMNNGHVRRAIKAMNGYNYIPGYAKGKFTSMQWYGWTTKRVLNDREESLMPR